MPSEEDLKIYVTKSGGWTMLQKVDQWTMEKENPSVQILSSCKATSLLANSTDSEKMTLVRLLKDDLDKKPSETSLLIINKKGEIIPYDLAASMRSIRTSPQNAYNGTSELKRFHKKVLDRLSKETPLSKDETDNERYVRGFIAFMMEIFMTEDYNEDYGWEYPLKSHVDATLIEVFLGKIHEISNGLTKEQCDRIDKTVIRLFNERAAEHRHPHNNDHYELVLQRDLNI